MTWSTPARGCGGRREGCRGLAQAAGADRGAGVTLAQRRMQGTCVTCSPEGVKAFDQPRQEGSSSASACASRSVRASRSRPSGVSGMVNTTGSSRVGFWSRTARNQHRRCLSTRRSPARRVRTAGCGHCSDLGGGDDDRYPGRPNIRLEPRNARRTAAHYATYVDAALGARHSTVRVSWQTSHHVAFVETAYPRSPNKPWPAAKDARCY